MSDEEYAYLRDSFNPNKLRKDQLRNILLTHGIEYTNDMLKPQLLEIFQEQIIPRRAELRARFVDVLGSAANIENATPPQSRGSRGTATSKREEDNDVPAPNESPRAQRARSRSPVRSRSPARSPGRNTRKPQSAAKAALQETREAEEPKLELSGSGVPKLEPPSSAPEPPSSAPEQPTSPRRRRANRKVEVPSTEPDLLDVPPTANIKIKAPRSPGRKRKAELESAEEDESFSSNNVFQARPKRQKANSPLPEAPQPEAPQPEAPQPEAPQQSQTHLPDDILDTSSTPAPVTEADIGIDILPLDADFVADLNAEVDRLETDGIFSFDGGRVDDEQQQYEPVAELEVEQQSELPSRLPSQSSRRESQRQSFRQPYPESERPLGEPIIPSSSHTSPSPEALREAFRDSRQAGPAAAVSPSVRTPAPRRRGFIPSFAELSVSRAFAEQLEPFLAASPTPTPRNHTPDTQRDVGELNSNSSPATDTLTSPIEKSSSEKRSESESPPVELPDAEQVAAHDVHEVIDQAAEVVHNSFGRMRLGLRVPRWRPRIPFPALRLPAAPRVRLPAVRMPALRLPRIHLPAVRVPRPSLPLPSLNTIGFTAFIIASVAVNTVLIVLGVLLAAWYRDAWASAEYCGVGAVTPHVYPVWTLYDTGYEPLSQLQTSFREMMDEVWPECVECPTNAQCYQGRIVMCNTGFRELEHPLSLGGLMPFPPRCLPDWEAQRKLDVLSERAASHLRKKRSQVLCDSPEIKDSESESASAIEAEALRSQLLSEKSPLLSDEEFGSLWDQVLGELPSRYADVYVVSFDPAQSFEKTNLNKEEHGHIYDEDDYENGHMLTNAQKPTNDHSPSKPKPSASSTKVEDLSQGIWLVSNSDALLPLRCKLMRWVEIHKVNIIYAVALLVSVSLVSTLLVRREKARRMQKKWVQSFVARLRNQRRAADEDASGKTVPYLRATDLRKEVPKSQWKKVQDSLEAEEGVRMRQIEIYGEITRIWEWTR